MEQNLRLLVAQGETSLTIHAIGLAVLIALASFGRMGPPRNDMASALLAIERTGPVPRQNPEAARRDALGRD